MGKKKERKLRKDWQKRYTFFEQPVEQVYRTGFVTSFYFKQYARFVYHLPVKKKVLAIGCFHGTLLSTIDRQSPIKGFYIDQAPRDMEQAIHLYPHFSYKQLKRTHIPYKENKFDVIYVSIPFHLFYEPEIMIAELIRTGHSFVLFDLRRYDWLLVLVAAGLLPKVTIERAVKFYHVEI
ncbi:methyltransferase domain-containing protein [Macrococcus brunensis]|uniref:methyltransferase domain-containing protein n=1 Tax=Macrococcus brunensis TaxID=198483 RepID=UPI001EF05DC7|nr:methyltransferase domain-containing protein [Macrococcus brunensis]ULG75028.1 hypothetical protein MGG13_04475 [Macrococcus brunensis]